MFSRSNNIDNKETERKKEEKRGWIERIEERKQKMERRNIFDMKTTSMETPFLH